MALIDNVKTALRLNSQAFDDNELSPLINAAEADMKRVGIIYNEQNPLCEQAVIFYCKANFGFADDQEKWAAAYAALRDALTLCSEYTRPSPPSSGGDGV